MVGFQLSPPQQAYAARVRQLAAEVLAPLVSDGPEGRVNRPLLAAMGQHGLLRDLFGDSAFADSAFGDTVSGDGTVSRDDIASGAAADLPRAAAAMQLCLLRESLAQVSGEAETALALQGLGSYPIVLAGRPETVRRWIPRVVSGEAVAAFALSEPQAGSDAAALSLRAESDGDSWRLTGEKMWISNAPEADVYTVFARTTPGARSRGITAFVVAGDSPGLHGEHLEMLSPHPIGRLTFDGVRVESDGVLGEVDQGYGVAMRTLDVFRPSVGAFAIGMAQAALDATIDHLHERQVQGGSLADQQAVRHAIADLATKLEASRLLVYAAAAAIDGGCDPREQSRRSAMAKLFATETAQEIIDSCCPVSWRGGAPTWTPARASVPRRPFAAHLRGRIGDPADHHRPRSDRQEEHRMTTEHQPDAYRFRASAPLTERWDHFRFSTADGVATITLDRPDKLNALTFEAYADLRDLLLELPHHRDVRVLVIRGEGKGFCGGGDVNEIIGELITMDARDLMRFTKMTGDVIRAMRECPVPIISVIHGIAAGAGAVVALASDFRVVGPDGRFAFLFTRVGLSGGDMGAAYLLPRVVGLGRATQLLMLGDTIDAATADRYGLVSELAAADELDGRVAALAARLATGPTLAFAQTKSLLTRELDMSLSSAMELDAMTQALLMTTHDHAEFHAAFNERRPPQWEGR